jgi:DNA-binding transcriptional LysR family regulator
MSTLPDFEGWAIFAKVAQRGSFSRAAEELGLAKTTVSKAVARLEARMRTNLFQRTTRKLTLTESGRQSLARATRILSDGAAIEADIIEETVSPRGLVRLAALSAMGIEIIAPALPEFLERFPDIEVDLVLTDNQVDIVAEGFDAAVQLEGSGASTLRSTRLWTLRRPLVAAPSLIERLGMPQGPEDLTRYPAVVASHIPDAMEWTFAHQNDAGGAPPCRADQRARPAALSRQPRRRHDPRAGQRRGHWRDRGIFHHASPERRAPDRAAARMERAAPADLSGDAAGARAASSGAGAAGLPAGEAGA